jgi:ATP-dependent DNA helicase PIF1
MTHADEDDLFNQINQAKAGGEETWEVFVQQIKYVKSQVMEFLEDNEEARMMSAEMMIDNALTGELMDPEGEQETEDNQLDTIMQHEEFQHLDPDCLEVPVVEAFERTFRPIEVRPLQQLRNDARKLDFFQRKVLEVGIKHARGLVKARGGKNPLPSVPLCMVDGAAGAGKSRTINILQEMLQLIMQQTGDDPECPYTLLCAPTGTAAVNIKGQTLHSALGFSFGNEHYSLSDKTRDTKRATFKNLRFLIIDEVSMVKADQLYQLDLRLRELTMKTNKLFGGVALFFFGDIMQLKPVLGRYIWSQPRNNEFLHAFLVQSHWELFSVISLVENHRQHGDAEYANTLNRIRVGEHTEQDLTTLQARVRPEGHADLKGALVIASKHEVVNHHNERCLEDLSSQLVTIEAINSHANLSGFMPKIDKKKKTVSTTPFLQTLKLKVGCRVMLTVNIDVRDCLCNGSIGTLRNMIKEKQNGEVKILMVEFDSVDSGQEMRRCHPVLASQFPRCTPIKKLVHKYSTSSNSRGAQAKAATVQQFPVILSFASTTHKIQGQTIASPSKVAIDLRSVFGPNQAYVMLGRIQELNQLYIIGSLPENKITVDKEALSQLAILKAKSINQNPPIWEKTFHLSYKVSYHNIHSLKDKFEDVQADMLLAFSDIIIFGETWLETNEGSEGRLPALCQFINNDTNLNNDGSSLHLHGYKLHLNSAGRGKGLAAYFKNEKFTVKQDITNEYLQLTVIDSENLCVVGLYRSESDTTLSRYLNEVIPSSGECVVIGDFNICANKKPNHEAFVTLNALGFHLVTAEATHIDGGHLDQIWLRTGSCKNDVAIYSPYYTAKDHDSLLLTLFDPTTEQCKV